MAAIDSSWELMVFVEELGPDAEPVTLRVTGSTHIGGVMLQTVEAIKISKNWSDHAVWWEQKRMWLLKTNWTLDKYGILADARLHYMPQHRPISLLLPNMRTVRLKASFSSPVFQCVVGICRLLNIRHPEELSLLRAPEEKEKKKKKEKDPSAEAVHDLTGLVLSGGSKQQQVYNGMPSYFTDSPETEECYRVLSISRTSLTPENIMKRYRPGSLLEKAQINSRWLDSSHSLMQQDVKENDNLWLRFKYYSFFDLEPKYDMVRINQLYEQARWAVLLEEIDCTEEEMMVFAALQYHINKLSLTSERPEVHRDSGLDDLDTALSHLEVKLGGSSATDVLDSLTDIPELKDTLRVFRPKRLTLKGYKPHWVVFKDTSISCYKSKEECLGEPVQQLNLKGCEVVPDVNVTGQKFCIKLLVPSPEGMSEVYLRCDNEHQYAKWMAACRLAAKGKTMADSTYQSEIENILSFLTLQKSNPDSSHVSADSDNVNTQALVSPRYQKKFKPKQLTPRILEAHQNVAQLSLTDAKMRFIQAWQSLPDFGVSYFLVRFKGCRKDEILGIANNRLIRIDLSVGDVVKTWRYSNMRQWNVNWDIRQVAIEFDEHINVAFSCISANCKIVHEYIGGYIFMSTRAKDQNETLNEELFHKLTGGHEAL